MCAIPARDMIEQFINFVIRPPRAVYDPDLYLWERDFTLAGRSYKREDLELQNGKGETLKCSHYVPSLYPEDSPLPCVVYCHGNSGCRADANEAAMVLLPANITLFTLDFSGSGLSDGKYVSLGWHERDDLRVVVSYLRSSKRVSRIGLWGRSMGAVTSLLYGLEDPSITGMVLDSAFSNFFNLMMELVDVYKIRLPKFTVKMAVQYMRRVIQKRAKFDIMDLNCMQVAGKTFIPALFGHATGDKFIQPHHSDTIFKCYAGDKNIIKFDGDHNSSRPQFYYDSVSIFLYNMLRPPEISSTWSTKIEKCQSLEDLRGVAGTDERLLYEIITDLHIASTGAASTSSVLPSISTTKCVGDSLSEIAPVLGTRLCENSSLAGDLARSQDGISNEEVYEADCHPMTLVYSLETKYTGDATQLTVPSEMSKDKTEGAIEEFCSYTSSDRESWGRCSSLESSDLVEYPTANSSQKIDSVVPGTCTPQNRDRLPGDESKTKDTEKVTSDALKKKKKPKREKFEALSQRLCLCILKRVNPRKCGSS